MEYIHYGESIFSQPSVYIYTLYNTILRHSLKKCKTMHILYTGQLRNTYFAFKKHPPEIWTKVSNKKHVSLKCLMKNRWNAFRVNFEKCSCCPNLPIFFTKLGGGDFPLKSKSVWHTFLISGFQSFKKIDSGFLGKRVIYTQRP